MKKLAILLAALLSSTTVTLAQRPAGGPAPMGMDTKNMSLDQMIVDVNHMDDKTRDKLNQVASNYRSQSRSAFTDIGKSMLYGGVSTVFSIIGNEIISLTKIRSQQKKRWMEMRQRENLFSDSLQSAKGQSDFYRKPSTYGALDPSDMNFDGITFRATRQGKDVLKMVCHIDTTRFDHLFLHSKFYLVLDTIEFHPYESYLPNLSANRINGIDPKNKDKEQIDFWNTISKFSFSEQKNPSINIRMDFFSSWINEAVMVQQDVKLGSFTLDIPINEMDIKDSVYFYSRQEAIQQNKRLIDISGDCFVVPRSYMPVSANNPSWGTGEYKMKVVMTERCQYNPTAGRSTNWHKDYKQLVRLQNHGKAKNEYISNVISTFRESKDNIIKATYTPLLNTGLSSLGLSPSAGGGASAAAMMAAKQAAAKQQGGGAQQGGMPQGNAPQGSAPQGK